MKVLETTPNATFTMGKKKHKLRNTKQSTPQDVDQSESSDDATPVAGASGQTCPHINKAVNLAAMRKAVQKQIFGECTSCAKEAFSGKKGDKPAAADVTAETEAGPLRSSTDDLFVEDSEPIIWVCLQCGHQGCDRNSDNKHSLRHHETPHSSCHSIVINTTSWAAWCYTCDDEVFIEGSKRLKEALEFLRKTAGVCSDVPAQPGRRGQVGGAGDDGQLNGRSRPSLGRTGSGQSPALCQKVKGLSNLGNTCFFNAVMQVLCQTPSLEALVGERGKKGCVLPLPGRSPDPDSDHSHSSTASSSEEELQDMDGDKNLGPIEVVLPDVGSLTQAVLNFLHEMNNTSGKSGTVTPNLLFGQVCKKAPRFRGYQQQDSHELLRYLLDNMKTEEIKRGRTGILKYFKLSENANPKKIDGCTRMKVKEYGRQAKSTFVDRVFGGQLISTVVCGECGYASQIYEPFLDLSLSITEEKPHRPNLASSVKKQANLESTVSAPKLNKQQQRKQKKLAKRDEKRKQKTAKNKVVPLSEFQSGYDGATPVSESGEVNSETAGDPEKTTVREADGSQDSDLEDTSDADVEDNVETDSLRNTAATITPTEDHGSGVIRSDVPAINGLVGGASGLETRVEAVGDRLSSLEIAGENVANGSSNEHLSHFPVGQQTACISGACSTISLQSTGSQCESSEVCGTPSPRPPHNGVTNNLTSDPAPGLSNGDLSLPRGHQEKSREQLKKEVRLRSMVTLGPRYQPLPRECSVLSSLHHFTSAELLAGNNKFGCRKCTKSQKEQTGKSEMVYTNASKHYLIFSPPAVLTLHFKRFEQIGFTSRKVNSHVDFPFLLDVSPFCSSLCQGRRRDQKQIVYSLYGVVEHSGRISGGHYTAYVKVRPNVGLVMDFLRAFAAHPRELVQQYTESFVAGRMDGRTDRSEDTSDASDVPIPPGRWYHISDSRVSEVQETSVQTAQAYMLFYERVC